MFDTDVKGSASAVHLGGNVILENRISTAPVATPAAPVAAPHGLRKSAFRDEREGVYHLSVPIDGCEILCLEMDDADYETYEAKTAETSDDTRRLIAIDAQAQALVESGKHEEAMKLRNSVDNDANKALADEQELQRLIRKNVVGWTRDRPFTEKSFSGLSGEAQTKVLHGILQASGLGRDAVPLVAGS